MGTILECEYLERLSTSSETQGHLVGTTGFSRAKVYNRSCCKLSPVKNPSSRLAAPGFPRMGFLALFYYLFSFWNRYNGSFFSFHIPTIVIIPIMPILILKETKTKCAHGSHAKTRLSSRGNMTHVRRNTCVKFPRGSQFRLRSLVPLDGYL